ncbi:response regulator [Chloroflexi bacterium TSY]|nr:response regulator [Chloroflexi bacterium TSY]
MHINDTHRFNYDSQSSQYELHRNPLANLSSADLNQHCFNYLTTESISSERAGTVKQLESRGILAKPSKTTVLVIDDNTLILESTTDLLEFLGLRILTATNGKEGLELYQKHQAEIGLVLLDIEMPVMDGPTTYNHLRRVNPDVKVIFSSGIDKNNSLQKCLSQETTPFFLSKPYELLEFTSVIEGALSDQSMS